MIMQMTGGSGRLGRAGRVLLLLIGACILPVLPARTQDSRRSRTEAEREVVHEREALETQMKDMARKLTWFRQAIKEALKNRAREKAAVLATQAARLETELALAKHGLARMKLRRQSKKTDQFEEIEEEIEEIEKGDAPPEGAQARRGQDATERTILRGLRSLEQGKVEAAAEAMRQLLRLHRSQKTRESRPGPVERWRGGQGRTDRNRMRELETQVRRLNRIVEELSRQIRGRRRSGRDR